MEGVDDMPSWYEWIGYAASLIVLISLVMSSVKRLRWINLGGSLVFAVYGILIKSYPVAVMNLGIVVVNSYYLYQIYHQKDALKIIPIKNDLEYVETFVNRYINDMNKFMNMDMDILHHKDYVKFFVTRNTIPAGLFVGKVNGNTFEIFIDYTTPTYRDFKIGVFIYEDNMDMFKDLGVHTLISAKGTLKHENYLKRMGFVLNEKNNEMRKNI